MAHLLRIDASARSSRSLSRNLGTLFLEAWQGARPHDTLTVRDLSLETPPPITERWIAAAFTPPAQRTTDDLAVLAFSDRAIDALVQADLIILTTPLYNYGMPSVLKAWVDMIVRVDRTFSFDLARGDFPLAPLLAGKDMVLLTASGEFGFCAGGIRAHMDHLTPHIVTLQPYLGVDRLHRISIEYQEFGDERHTQSVRQARQDCLALVERMVRGWETRASPSA